MPRDSASPVVREQTATGTYGRDSGSATPTDASTIFSLSQDEGRKAVPTAFERLVAAGNDAIQTRISSSDTAMSPKDLVALRDKFMARAGDSVAKVLKSFGLELPRQSRDAVTYGDFLKNDPDAHTIAGSDAYTGLRLHDQDGGFSSFTVKYTERTDDWGSGQRPTRLVTFKGIPANPEYGPANAKVHLDSLTIDADSGELVQPKDVAKIDASMFFAEQHKRQTDAQKVTDQVLPLPSDRGENEWAHEALMHRMDVSRTIDPSTW